MMKTIVGLFRDQENVLHSLDELNKAGIGQEEVSVLVCNASGRARIGEAQNRLVTRYALLGALIGIAVADSFGLILGLSALPVYEIGLKFFMIALIVFTGIGTALGGLLGVLLGVDSLERVSQLYTEGMRGGGLLEIIETSSGLAARAIDILQQDRAVVIEVYPQMETGSYHALPADDRHLSSLSR